MSWMTDRSAVSAGGAMAVLLRCGGTALEQLGHPVPALVEAVQRKVQLGDHGEDPVVDVVMVERDAQRVAVPGGRDPAGGERGRQLVDALTDLHGEYIAVGRHVLHGRRTQQPAAVDGDE